MPIIVADTSPLSLLIRIGEVSLLHQLFERVVIPDEVLAELRHGNAPDVVGGWCAQLPGWIDVRSPKRAKQNDQLDPGELAAISLALELTAPLLMDERLGRAFARRQGLEVIGVIGLLEMCANQRLIKDLAEVHQRIRGVRFHVSGRLLNESLARHLALMDGEAGPSRAGGT